MAKLTSIERILIPGAPAPYDTLRGEDVEGVTALLMAGPGGAIHYGTAIVMKSGEQIEVHTGGVVVVTKRSALEAASGSGLLRG